MSFEVSVRPPTATAWVLTAIFVILTGELYRELDSAVPMLMGQPMTPGLLWPFVAVSGALGLLSMVWLVSLYAMPGKLSVQEGRLTRLRRRPWGFQRTEGPLSDWRVQIWYFSEEELRRGTFKRIELRHDEFVEILLFTDVRDGATLSEKLEEIKSQLGKYERSIERPEVSGTP